MPTLTKAKVFPITAQVNETGHLLIGGCDVMDIVREHGTPTYVYDEATLKSATRAYTTAFQSRYPNTLVAYASKAFINLGLAKLLAEEGVGFDVVSGGEMAVVQTAGVPHDRVHFHGNNKTPQELQEAVEWGIGRVVIDSFHEIEVLEEVAATASVEQPVLIRVSPGVDPHTHAHTTTGILDSKFGFPIQTGQAQEAIRRVMAAPHLDLRGLHFHLGSPIFELEPYVQAIGIVLGFAKEMGEEGLVLREFSPGGGFAIAYVEEDEPPTPDDYAEAIVGALRHGCQELNLPEPSLIIEPGRAITGPAAVALYTVGTIKEVPGIRTFVAVDGGMGDNIRPALYDSKYEALVANHASEPPTQTVTIAGKYCESGDILVKDARIPAVQAGDIIAIPAAGAYSPSMASTYNLNGRPPILLAANGKVRVVRRRETYADLMSADVV